MLYCNNQRFPTTTIYLYTVFEDLVTKTTPVFFPSLPTSQGAEEVGHLWIRWRSRGIHQRCQGCHEMPGKLTVCYWKLAIYFVDLPKSGDLSWFVHGSAITYQRVCHVYHGEMEKPTILRFQWLFFCWGNNLDWNRGFYPPIDRGFL
jgi:hypothetical protein